MDKHWRTLFQQLEDEPCDFDINSIFKDIESVVKHLHSLGLAHNDLNPMNIMTDKKKRPILIDFGSCKPFGRRLMESGSPGWVDEAEVCINPTLKCQ